mgnify:CR=1 FL=1
MSQHLAFFENYKIRRTYDERTETWLFSVVDIMQVLTQQSDFQAARKYWNKLKERLKKEGSESVTNCHQLKLKASDGKKYLTDVANVETLLRLIQSIPSPKAEPFKSWLTKVGYERIEDDNIPDFYKVYCERELVSLNTASMLWLDINPDEFNDQEEYYQYLVERKLYQKAINNRTFRRNRFTILLCICAVRGKRDRNRHDQPFHRPHNRRQEFESGRSKSR